MSSTCASRPSGGTVTSAARAPSLQLKSHLATLPHDKTIITVGASGHRSASAARMLQRAGHNVENLEGGTHAWTKAGLAVESRSARSGCAHGRGLAEPPDDVRAREPAEGTRSARSLPQSAISRYPGIGVDAACGRAWRAAAGRGFRGTALSSFRSSQATVGFAFGT
jgi:3-mercaptopyruvate sulfurtransferase SseA